MYEPRRPMLNTSVVNTFQAGSGVLELTAAGTVRNQKQN